MSSCFDRAVQSLFSGATESIYSHLSKRGIDRTEISDKFELVEEVLYKFMGLGAKSIIIVTLENLCKEYSIPLKLEYASSLAARFRQITERVLVDMLTPKHYRKRVDIEAFLDKKLDPEQESGEYYFDEVHNYSKS